MMNKTLNIVGVSAAFSVAATTLAGHTTINAPASGELGHESILEGIYGGDFSSSGLDFTGSGASAGISALRMDDFGIGGPLDAASATVGGADDEVWTGGSITATAKARYAGDNQSFGYFGGASGGSFTPLFAVGSSGFSVTGSGAIDFGGGDWRWGRGANAAGPHSSLAADNPDGADHMVTYMITGLSNGAARTWLLFFEDRNQPHGDFDYNDLVVEVQAIPTPMAAGLGAAALAGFTTRRRRNNIA